MSKYGGNNRIDFGVHFNTDKSSLEEVKKSLQALQNIKPIDFKGSEKELKLIQNLAREVENALQKAFNVKLNAINVDQFKNSLQTMGHNLDSLYAKLSESGSVGRAAFNQVSTAITTTNVQLRESTGLLQTMGTTMMNTVKWGIASSVMNNFTQSVSLAFQYVKSLDSALTDIRIVTGDSTEQMANFADQANRAAQELGRSTMDYSKAALTFYQQGLSDEDVAARTEATLKAQNITGAGELMANYLTAVWNGYKVANEEAELYVDKLAAVADSSASNMALLAVAMSKVASTANMLGVPVDSLNAQIATIEATTRQAPETVGNALKTIYARINDIATGADNALVSLGNYTSKMAELGVNVLDSNGKLRDTGDVIELIGGKWETLSREQQIYLARTMAGQRQYNNLLALFENWSKYTDLINVSMEAQGTTAEKNSRYMDSLAAHMEQLGAAGERVKSAMIDSDSFKGLIDIGTTLTNFLANFIESIGGGGTALLGLGSIATQVFSGIIAKEISNVIIRSRENKQIYEEMQRAMQLTQNAKTSAAYLDPVNTAYKLYINNLLKVHQSWSVLSQDERQLQQNNIIKIRNLSEEKNGLLANINAALRFYQTVSKGKDINNLSENRISAELKAKLIPAFEEASQAYQEFWMLMQNNNADQGIEELYEKVLLLGTALGGDAENSAWEFALALEKTQLDADYTSREFDELINNVERFINQAGKNISLVQNYNSDKNKIQDLKQELQGLNTVVEQTNQNAQTAWNTQNIVKMVGAVGQLASGFLSVINVVRILKNDSLSAGEKVLQVITNLAFSLPMIIRSLETIQTLFGFQNTFGQIILNNLRKRLIAEKLITTEKEKQLLIDKMQAGDRSHSTVTAYNQILLKIKGLTKEQASLTTGFGGFFKTISSGFSKILTGLKAIAPQLSIVGGLLATVFIAKKVADYGMRVLYATKRLELFKAQQKEINDTIKDTRTKTGTLESSLAEYLVLAKKAGANTGDSTIDRLTEAEKERYNELKNLIAEYNEDAVVGYDLQGNAILKNNNALKDTIDLLKEKNKELLKSFYNSKEYKQAVKDRQTVYEGAAHAAGKESGAALQGSRKHEAEIDLKAYQDVIEQVKHTYKEENEEFKKLLEKGIDNLDEEELTNFHKNLLSKLQLSNPELAKALEARYKEAQEQLNVYKEGLLKLGSSARAAKEKAEQLGKFTLDQVVGPLIANSEDGEYNNLAEQFGESTINGIISSYIAGLSRGDVSEEDLPEKVRTDLLKPLDDINFTEDDFDEIKNSVSKAMLSIDVTSLTGLEYTQKVQEAIQNVLNNSSKLQEMQKKAPEAFNSIIKNLFNVEDFTIDKDGLVTKIVDEYTKASDLAQSKIDIYTQEHGISLKSKLDNLIKEWISNQDISTLSNLDSILGNINEKVSFTADLLERAKNETKNLTSLDSLSEAAGLLQKKASGETLDDTEKEALEAKLSELRTLIPEFKGVIQILETLWLDGTDYQQHAIESIVNATFDSIDKMKQARLAILGVSLNSPQDANQYAASDTESQKAKDLIYNTENLQAALERGILTLDDYRDKLGELGSKYLNAKELSNLFAQAVAALNGAIEQLKIARLSGDLATIKAAEKEKEHAVALRESSEAGLLLATRAGELAAASDIEASAIERTANWLVENNILGTENTKILKENVELQADAAEQYIRLNQGLDDLYTNFDKYNELLKEVNLSGQDAINVFDNLTFDNFKESVADLFGTSSKALDDNWIVLNMGLILRVAKEADEEGLQKLRASAEQEIYAKLNLDDDDFVMKSNQFFSTLDGMKEGAELNLDMTTFVQQMVTAMQMAGMGQTLIEQRLSGMNISVDLQPYRQGLNHALEMTKTAAGTMGETLAKGIAVSTNLKTQDVTNLTEDVYTAPKIEPGTPVTGTFRFPVAKPSLDGITPNYEEGTFEMSYPTFTAGEDSHKAKKESTTTVPALEVVSANKKFGGKISNFNMPAARKARKARTGSGSSKKSGGSSAQPKTMNKAGKVTRTLKKKTDPDPYYKINNSIKTQDKLLKTLSNTEKNVSGKDRLKNLLKQNKEIENQLKNYKEYLRISKSGAQNTTSGLLGEVRDYFGKGNVKVDTSTGYISNLEDLKVQAINEYNKAVGTADADLQKAYDDYDAFRKKYLKASASQQKKLDGKKQKVENNKKEAEEDRKEAVDQAKKEYDEKIKALEKYQKALAEDLKIHEAYLDALRQKLENTFEKSKIKVDLALDTGLLERDWLDFENKFIKKLGEDDILGNAIAKLQKMNTYVNTLELSKVNSEIAQLTSDLNKVQSGGWANNYTLSEDELAGLSAAEIEEQRTLLESKIQERLKELQEKQKDALLAMQDLTDLIKEEYLDALDLAKDKMEDHIDQYDRINDLIEHNIKLTELLYGEKGYDTLNKYYQLQKNNNYSTLETLKEQEAYWRDQLNRTNYADNPKAWEKMKENLDNVIDQINSKMEDMLDNLAKEFENKMNAAIDRVNNRLTNNLGTTYLDEQWDYLNNYDDYFLDTYNATTGVEDVTRAYQQAIDDAAANPKQQQKLNKLMNDQLTLLQEKDKLTQYDLDRAKALLEVEKARMALEDARNNKTKMRLRRDSQGNYTYQYVADEEKLGDLQQALADAQNDLYNTDKEHYKENLNELYETYKEYLEKRANLEQEMSKTQDEVERERIQQRIKLLDNAYSEMYEGLTEDNKYNMQYLIQSFSSGMNLDFSGLNDEEQWLVIRQEVPWAQSHIQDLADSIVGEGGLIPATKLMVQELGLALEEYDLDVQQILETSGTNLDNITNVTNEYGLILDQNIQDALAMLEHTQSLVDATKQSVEEMQNLLDTVDQYWLKNMAWIEKYVAALQKGQDALYNANALEGETPLTTEKVGVQYNPVNSTIGTSGLSFTGNISTDTATLSNLLNNALLQYKEFLTAMTTASLDTGGYTGVWGEDGKLALLHQKELVLNPTDTENILAAVTAVRDATSNMNIQSLLNSLGNNTSSLLKNLIENSTLLDQNVHIDANFPNVTQHTLIEEAFNNLVNMAAMRASEYRK